MCELCLGTVENFDDRKWVNVCFCVTKKASQTLTALLLICLDSDRSINLSYQFDFATVKDLPDTIFVFCSQTRSSAWISSSKDKFLARRSLVFSKWRKQMAPSFHFQSVSHAPCMASATSVHRFYILREHRHTLVCHSDWQFGKKKKEKKSNCISETAKQQSNKIRRKLSGQVI